MNERIKYIRESYGLTQEAFGERIGAARNTIANYENGNRTPSNAVILSICREFSVSKDWLLTGVGEMHQIVMDEAAIYVSQLLKGEEDNPVFELIRGIMKTFNSLDPKSQEVLKYFAKKLMENLKSGE